MMMIVVGIWVVVMAISGYDGCWCGGVGVGVGVGVMMVVVRW